MFGYFLFVLVGVYCLWTFVKVFNAEEQNKVFTKYKFPVTDVHAYNKACAWLILGYGIAAEALILGMILHTGIWTFLFLLGILVVSFIVVKIYQKIEKKYIVKR